MLASHNAPRDLHLAGAAALVRAQLHADARPVGDFPVATHDGRIWPNARPDMTDAAAIVARMAEDIWAMASAGGFSLSALVMARGWTVAQVNAHARGAAILAERTAKTSAARDMLAGIVATRFSAVA
jgi:hypothetical protein